MTVYPIGKHSHDPSRALRGTENVRHAEHKVLNRVVAESLIINAAPKSAGVDFVKLKHVDATHVVVSH